MLAAPSHNFPGGSNTFADLFLANQGKSPSDSSLEMLCKALLHHIGIGKVMLRKSCRPGYYHWRSISTTSVSFGNGQQLVTRRSLHNPTFHSAFQSPPNPITSAIFCSISISRCSRQMTRLLNGVCLSTGTPQWLFFRPVGYRQDPINGYVKLPRPMHPPASGRRYRFHAYPLCEGGRFQGWDCVPLTVSVILVVPRDKLRVFTDGEVGIPVLHGNLHGQATHNIFASLRVGFAKVTPSGTVARPRVVFEPDPSSWEGTFSVPSHALHIESPNVMSVTLSLRSTPGICMMFAAKLGMFLTIFSAPLMDRSRVLVVPDEPQGLSQSLETAFATDNHQGNSVSVTTDPQSRRAATLTVRENVTDVLTRDILSGGAQVSCHQVSWRLQLARRNGP